MRKLVSGLFISVDGVAENPGQWQENFDDDMGEHLAAFTSMADAVLLGRVTYEEWADYWPNKTDDFAPFINNVQKYVVSSTLTGVAWGDHGKIELIKGADLVVTINDLKQQPGGTISVSGSPTLVRSLVQLGLLDELKLFIHPVVVGSGKKLFTDDTALTRLTLLSAQVTRTGTLIANYQPRGMDV